MGHFGFLAQLVATFFVALTFAFPATAQEVTTYKYDALGRLIETGKTLNSNPSGEHSLCYDPAGNRTEFDSSTGSAASCSGGGGVGSNLPPVTTSDSVSVLCNQSTTVNVISNDSDPEGHTPLKLVSVTVTNGDAGAAIVSSSTLDIVGDIQSSTSQATYVIEDKFGAASEGSVTITTTGAPAVCQT